MKRFLMRGFALMMILSMMASTALAVDVTIMRVDVEEAEARGYYPQFQEIVTVGDTVYLLACLNEEYFAGELLRWQPGMETAERCADGMLYGAYFDSAERAEGMLKELELEMDLDHSISRMFTDGERLLAINHLNGKIFAIKVEGDKVQYEDIVTMKDTSPLYHQEEDYAYFRMSSTLDCVGDKLVWYYNDWDNQAEESVSSILTISLKDGSVRDTKIGSLDAMTAYKDGKVLILSRDREKVWDEKLERYYPMNVLLFDPETGKTESGGEFQYTARWSPDYIAYSPALDALVYSEDTRVMGAFGGLKDLKQIGYVPTSYITRATIVGDTLVFAGSDIGVIARTLSKDFKTDEYVNVFDGYMDRAAKAFAEEFPQIPVYSVKSSGRDAVSIDLAMNAGADAPDIMQLYMAYGVYTRLAEKGYCDDLSGYPKLAAYVNDLYPVYRDAVTGPNGEIYAIPIAAHSWDGYSINKKVMNDMGLTPEELPSNLVELCEFVTRWNDEFVDKYPNYTVLGGVSDYKAQVFEMMFTRYIAYYNAIGEPLKFDTPIFREMMAALEAMESKELEDSLKNNPDPEVSDYKQGIIWRSDMLVGGWSNYAAEESDRVFLPMGLNKDAGFHTGAEVRVMFLNPKSQHKASAVRLMEYMVEKMYDSDAYVLLSTKTEPVENKYFEEWMAYQQEDLAAYEKSLAEAAEEDKADWQMALDEKKAFIERRAPEIQYEISPQAIKNYREVILPYVYVVTPTFLDSSDEAVTGEFDSLKKQYQDGKIDIERFIREADGKLMMMQNE